jgi:hypothetical protein
MLKGMDEMSRQNQILIKAEMAEQHIQHEKRNEEILQQTEMAEQHIQHEKRNEEILQQTEMYKELNRQLDVALKGNNYF